MTSFTKVAILAQSSPVAGDVPNKDGGIRPTLYFKEVVESRPPTCFGGRAVEMASGDRHPFAAVSAP